MHRSRIALFSAAALAAGLLETYPVRSSPLDLVGATDSVTVFVPARRT